MQVIANQAVQEQVVEMTEEQLAQVAGGTSSSGGVIGCW